MLTHANVDDRNDAVIDTLTDRVFGKLYADKGYISQSLFGRLWSEGIHVVTGLRSNMKQRLMPLYDKIMLRKRSIIETVNDMLKNVAQLVHTRHRSVHNFLMNLLAAMGRTASSSPNQQSTSTTRCQSQTVSSLFGNSPNPIFSQKRIRRPRPWSPDTLSASESRLFSPRLSRTRVFWFGGEGVGELLGYFGVGDSDDVCCGGGEAEEVDVAVPHN